MTDPYAMNPEILAAEAETKAAEVRENETIARVQAACPHVFVGEAPYRESDWVSDAAAPFRVCFNCGLKQEGWGGASGPLWSREKVVTVTRDEGLKIWRRC